MAMQVIIAVHITIIIVIQRKAVFAQTITSSCQAQLVDETAVRVGEDGRGERASDGLSEQRLRPF